jgi:hydroxymethylbilane synthase
MGGCTTPISALAQVKGEAVEFVGQLMSLDGTEKIEVAKSLPLSKSDNIGLEAGLEILENGGASIIEKIKQGG